MAREGGGWTGTWGSGRRPKYAEGMGRMGLGEACEGLAGDHKPGVWRGRF